MLLDYANLQAVGYPIERDELKREQWHLLGIVKSEIEKIIKEEVDAARKKEGDL